MSAGRRKRREEHEEHENHERWLVTYADMVTLLMVLFIVMFSMSVVDERKFNALKAGLAAGFGQSTSVLVGSESILEQPGVSAVQPVRADLFLADVPPEQREAVSRAVAEEQRLERERRYADAQAEVDRLAGLMRELEEALEAAGLRHDVRAGIDDRGLVLSLTSRHVVFEPNLADLSDRGREVLDVVAPTLRRAKEDLRVDGHTNQVPVKPKYFATDWELSAARAVAVLRHLNEQGGIPNGRMSAAAYGHEKPLVDPAKPGSQRVNKRVDVVVLSDLPPATRALLDEVRPSAAASRGAAPTSARTTGGTR
ncbi:OmpA/MotB family protein [Nocardioides euryhalodurans]|uniref:Flagellar motor protein MotB n=1 Tax=Nocardioides euryhalodurans TaxID=2518370 RepID=A0A4P7GK29_9ACTN|nr:flagellar motor protein MotB [Nocardioides euryhalodurans]QBR92380.1 flagellar motor protein MotB [Nocardioides euryhalodurans]